MFAGIAPMGLKYISHKALVWIKVAIAIILVTMLIFRTEPKEIYFALLNADMLLILCALALLPLNIFFQYSRWRILVRLANPQSSSSEIFSSLLCGITLGFITPGRVGEFGRSFFIPTVQWPRLMGLTMLDKLFAMMVLFALGLAGIAPFLHQNVPSIIWLPLMLSGLGFLTLFFILLWSPQFVSSLLLRRQSLWKKHPKWRQMVSSLELLNTSTATMVAIIAFAQVITYSFQFYLLVSAFTSVSIFYCMAAIAAIMWVKTMLPISLGDLGVRESAAIFFLGQIGVPEAAAFDASMLLFAMNVLLPAIIGSILLFKMRTPRHLRV